MQSPIRSKRWVQRLIIGCASLYSVIFVLMLIFRPGSKTFYHAFNNVYQILPPLFAGICGLVLALGQRHISKPKRVGWLGIGLGGLSFATGQCIWTYYESIRGVEVPFPGWADAGYLGAYPFLFGGVILLFEKARMAGRARQVLDAFIAASGVGMLSWFFLVQRLWIKSDVTMLGKVISVAYPLCDVAGICAALILLVSAANTKIERRSFATLAAGLIFIAFFDSMFTLYSLNDSYQTGSWFDWSLSFGWLLIGFAALNRIWAPAEAARNQKTSGKISLAQVVTPYAIAVGCSSIVIYRDYATDHRFETSTLVAGTGLIFLVIARQVFTLMENLYLTNNLERIVKRRTEQLEALHGLTAAVNNTLQPGEVLGQAARHTLKALHADAVAIWTLEHDEAKDSHFLRLCLHQGFENHPDMFQIIADQTPRDTVELFQLPASTPGTKNSQGYFLCAPLRWQQRPLGMIGVIRWNDELSSTEAELLESIGIEVGTAMENARLYSAAVEAADRDHVTGLFNHRAMHQRMEREIQHSSKQKTTFAVVMLDMNNFKLFNDTYGHPAGDQVLKLVADALRNECSPEDILGRYGGDEYILIFPNTDEQGALEKSERIRAHMAREGFRRPGEDRIVPITLSLGIAMYPADGANRHELLTNADANLYSAKRTEEGIVYTSDNRRANRGLRAEQSFTVLDAMVTAVDNKDRYTRRHSEDVTEYALWIAEELRLSDETLRVIRIGGLLHDVGKIAVPDEILRKPGRLTEEEYEILKRHPAMGALIVGSIPGMETIVDAVRYHHERWDGRGYPEGLQGEDTPLLGRILAVADAFSAMTTERPYRKGLDWEDALREIRSGMGTQFDPTMAAAFLRAAEKQRALRGRRKGDGLIKKAA